MEGSPKLSLIITEQGNPGITHRAKPPRLDRKEQNIYSKNNYGPMVKEKIGITINRM